MVSVLASSVVDRGFESRSGQTKDYNTGICCFSAKHAALRKKSKDWLARNKNNMSEWSDISKPKRAKIRINNQYSTSENLDNFRVIRTKVRSLQIHFMLLFAVFYDSLQN